jgi:hypothetical protein
MPSLLVSNRVYRPEIQSVRLVFSTGFVNYYLSLTFSLIIAPLYTVSTYTVCKGEGGGEYGVIGGEGASDG